jgi:hypothetical protein
MLRAVMMGGALWALADAPALACEDPDNIRGIIYEAVPADIPPSTLVLDVEFDPDDIAAWRGGPMARVRRVVQGDYDEELVRVGLIHSSCLYPFAFGTEGLIIGTFREGVDAITVELRRWPDGARVSSEIRLGFEGTWFSPLSESIAERRRRAGRSSLAP